MDINTFSKLGYGVYVVASGDKERQNAFIATAVMQVTAEPAKIIVDCHKNNFTANLIRELKAFSVSVINQKYKPTTIGTFGFRSGKDCNKFENCKEAIFGENTNVPIVLEDCVAWFECKMIKEMDIGTHVLFVGEVLDAQITAQNEVPLTYSYYHEIKRGVTAKNAPSYNKK